MNLFYCFKQNKRNQLLDTLFFDTLLGSSRLNIQRPKSSNKPFLAVQIFCDLEIKTRTDIRAGIRRLFTLTSRKSSVNIPFQPRICTTFHCLLSRQNNFNNTVY